MESMSSVFRSSVSMGGDQWGGSFGKGVQQGFDFARMMSGGQGDLFGFDESGFDSGFLQERNFGTAMFDEGMLGRGIFEGDGVGLSSGGQSCGGRSIPDQCRPGRKPGGKRHHHCP